MSTKERVEKIEIECRNLLAIAEKRTPGTWLSETDDDSTRVYIELPEEEAGPNAASVLFEAEWAKPEDADYIASCAGLAESGWRVTLGRIDFVKKLRAYDAELNPIIHSLADEEEAAIVADWEEGNH